jgi:hypothetical protein
MNDPSTRDLTRQLAEDLGWLEEHCRRQPGQAVQAVQLRLAGALVRNCIGPFLESQDATPLHVAVLGGAGAGKSTVANMLTGTLAAEANPQAGFTRHPIAYVSTNGPLTRTGHPGFLGPLQRLAQPSPSSLDADVFQVRHVPPDPVTAPLMKDFVVWDCPDMTTWAATGYVPRLLEVAALADVVVYVASDERYNDEVPTQFLKLLLETGKPVIACLTKMREAIAQDLLTHFQREVLGKLPAGTVGSLTVPHLNPDQLRDPARQAPQWRIPLVNQVAVLGSSPLALRKRNVRVAMNYLLWSQNILLGSAAADVAALQTWESLVRAGQAEFDERYRREYLASEKYRGFDEALVRFIELLELPGVGRYLSNAMWVLRMPGQWLGSAFKKALARPEAAALPEEPMLRDALDGWMDGLRREAASRADVHPLFAHVEKGFNHGLADLARERFGQGFRSYHLGLADEVERAARAIYTELEKRPGLLNTLRGSKLALDVAGVGGAIALIPGLGWPEIFLVPLAASATHWLVELLGKQYVDSQRELTRQKQQALVAEHISAPLGDWLSQWPATGGSAYERLQLALKRLPGALQQLGAQVTRAVGG